jgi:Na+/proline symporter
VTDVPLWILIIAVGLLCTVYTSIGGIKAVVWTDAFQMVVMMLGCVAVWIRGGAATGGWAQAWKTAQNGGRLDGFHDFDPDPFQRMTVWTALIGGVFYWATAFGGSQVALQRCSVLFHKHYLSTQCSAGTAVCRQCAGLRRSHG